MILSEGILIESTGNEILFPAAMPFKHFLGQKPTDKRRNKSFLGDRQNFLAIEYRARGWSDNDKDHIWSISDGVPEV